MEIKTSEFFKNIKTLPPPDSSEFKQLINWEIEKCLGGVTIQGVFISGWLYWHVNHWHIALDEEDEFGNVTSPPGLADLRDNEWERAEHLENCRRAKKGYIEVGGRQLGKSVQEASFSTYNSILFENSQNVIIGNNSNDLDMLKHKIDFGLKHLWEGINIPRLDKTWRGNQVRLGYKEVNGDDVEWSRILIRNTDSGKNTEVAAGTTAKSFVMDEIGKSDFAKAYEAAKPAFRSKFGFRAIPMLVGTGGAFEKGDDAERIFYNPEANEFLGVEDPISGVKTGLFMSGIYRQDCKYKTTLADFLRTKKGLVIEDSSELEKIEMWVADEEKARDKILKEREIKKKDPDQAEYLKLIMYNPLTPEECFMRNKVSVFNTEAAKAQKQRIINNNLVGSNIFLHHDGEKIAFEYTEKRPISRFPHSPNDDLDAPIQVWEFPPLNPPHGLFVAGCLLPGEKVMSDKGLKSVENVLLEDKLVNIEGKYVDINNLQRYYKQDCDVYTFKLSNLIRTTTFTEEHPIFVHRPDVNNRGDVKSFDFKTYEFKEAKDVQVGDWLRVPNIYKKINNNFKSRWPSSTSKKEYIINPLEVEDFWWLIGLFLGDGWVYNYKQKDCKISISINISERYYINKLENVVLRLFNRKLSKRERRGCVECSFNSSLLGRFINENFGKYAYGKFIPEWVKKLPNNLKRNLVLGYLDSDGCVCWDKKKNLYSLDFVSISLELIEDIQDILFSLGVVSNANILRQASSHTIGKKQSKTKITYQLRTGNTATLKFAKLFKDPIGKLSKIDLDSCKYTNKKKGCFLSTDEEFIFFDIREITKSNYTGWVYNFECDTHTYMCKGIPTHNCDPYSQTNSKYSKSLGAIYIFKRMSNVLDETKYQYRFVASYVARPNEIDKFNEQCRLLIKWYNAIALCENDVMLFIEYMKSKGDAHYLQTQPQWLESIHSTSTVKRGYGIHSTPQIIAHRDGHLKNYLEEVLHIEKDDQGSIIKEVTGVSTIMDPMLLEEIIKYDPNDKDWNGDRIVAAGLAITQAKHMDPIVGMVGKYNDKFESYFNRKKKGSSLFHESRSSLTRKDPLKKLFK